MPNHGRVAFVVLALVSLGAVVPAGATNGYFSHGYGTIAKGMGGACVALPLDTMAPATNPAAMAFVGPRWDIGVALFSPDRDYEVVGTPSRFPGTFGLAPGVVESGSTLFVVPHAGGNWRFGRRVTVGVALYGNGGMNTHYDAPTFGFAPTGVDLSQMFIAPTLAFKVSEQHALGVTGLLAYQRFRAQGLTAFSPFSRDPAALTDNGHANSFGAGLRVGYLGRLTTFLSVGASYQAPVRMGALDEYAGLFAGQGGFDVPSNWVAGIAVRPTRTIDVAVDVQQVRYSEVASVANPMLPNLALALLGDDDGAGFGWKDMTTYKVGVQYRQGRHWTWRGGYSYGEQPIPETEVLFNILAPGVMEQHVTFGLTRALGTGRALNLSVMRAFARGVTGPNPLEVPERQQITLDMDQWDIEVSYSFGFGR